MSEIWNALTAIGTITTSVVAVYFGTAGSRQTSRQLKIEQEPYVVAEKTITSATWSLQIKNIGRGPALRVTVSSSTSDKDKPLFEAAEPHSCDLASKESIDNWRLDERNLKMQLCSGNKNTEFEVGKHYNLYIHYSDQLDNRYLTKITFEYLNVGGAHLKVMENVRV